MISPIQEEARQKCREFDLKKAKTRALVDRIPEKHFSVTR